MSLRPRAFDGYAFDDDAFDCEFFQPLTPPLDLWTAASVVGVAWVPSAAAVDVWAITDKDDG
jgi:hypothetical protein